MVRVFVIFNLFDNCVIECRVIVLVLIRLLLDVFELADLVLQGVFQPGPAIGLAWSLETRLEASPVARLCVWRSCSPAFTFSWRSSSSSPEGSSSLHVVISNHYQNRHKRNHHHHDARLTAWTGHSTDVPALNVATLGSRAADGAAL